MSTKLFKLFAAVVPMALAVAGSAHAAGRKTKIDTPSMSCGASGQGYIEIQVCAPGGTGATGLPAGFTVQWMSVNALAAGADGIPGTADDGIWFSSCDASFSGNASFSRYSLAAGQCITVRIGEILFDAGASTNCPDKLLCGTTYVFRAFGHATNTLNRSDFSSNLICSTLSCGDVCDPNVKSQGFWKNHFPDAWPADVLANGMTIGCQTYSAVQLESILLLSPSGGNALIALAHQVIDTRLNIAAGAGTDYLNAVSADLAAAEALMCTTGAVPPVGTGSLTGAQAGALILALDSERDAFECP